MAQGTGIASQGAVHPGHPCLAAPGGTSRITAVESGAVAGAQGVVGQTITCTPPGEHTGVLVAPTQETRESGEE
eukprot:8024518-Prorocentrum_lima.AAC.1